MTRHINCKNNFLSLDFRWLLWKFNFKKFSFYSLLKYSHYYHFKNQTAFLKIRVKDFPGCLVIKNLPAKAGDMGLIHGLGRSFGEGKGYTLQYSGLDNSMDCIVHGVAKSWTWLATFTHSLTVRRFQLHKGTTRLRYNSWAHLLQLLKPMHPRAHALQQETPMKQEGPAPQLETSPCSPQLQKAHVQQQRPGAAKNKSVKF